MLRSSGSTLSPSPSPDGSILSSQSLTRACGSRYGVEYRSPRRLRALPSGFSYWKLCLVQCMHDCSHGTNPPTMFHQMLYFTFTHEQIGQTSSWPSPPSAGQGHSSKNPNIICRGCFHIFKAYAFLSIFSPFNWYNCAPLISIAVSPNLTQLCSLI